MKTLFAASVSALKLSAIVSALTPFFAFAAPVEIIFNWKTGDTGDYALEVISERPKSPGVPCTINSRRSR